MKKFKIALCIILSVCTIGAFGVASADTTSKGATNSEVISSGEAMMDDVYCSSVQNALFDIHNITEKPINVSVVFYKQDGTILKDDGSDKTGLVTTNGYEFTNYSNYSESGDNVTVSFTLNAHSSGGLKIGNGSTRMLGYGVIKWSQSGTTYKGLIARGEFGWNNNSSVCFAPIDINSGLPF